MLGFSVRAGYLAPDRRLMLSLAKFVACGILLAATLWLTARFSRFYLASMPLFRDETTLLLLVAVAAFVYAMLVLVLFGRGWLFSLLRG